MGIKGARMIHLGWTIPGRLNKLKFFFGVSTVMLGFAFIRYFDRWVYFPFFPNILDSVAMWSVAVILLYDVVKDSWRQSVHKAIK